MTPSKRAVLLFFSLALLGAGACNQEPAVPRSASDAELLCEPKTCGPAPPADPAACPAGVKVLTQCTRRSEPNCSWEVSCLHEQRVVY